MSDLDKLGCWRKEGVLLTEERAADRGESMAGQRYNCNWLLHSSAPNLRTTESGDWRKWDSKHEQIATTAKCSATTNFNNVSNVMYMHQNNMGNSSVILSRSQKT